MYKPVIICVDDESVILQSIKIQLKQEFQNCYQYELAESAEEALEIIAELQAENLPIAAVISDWLMPGMKGDQLLLQVAQKSPTTVKIMLTGQADEKAIAIAQELAYIDFFLDKPWEKEDLVQAITSKN